MLDEHGEVRSLVHVYVDGERAHDLTPPVGEKSRIRIVAAIAGGSSDGASEHPRKRMLIAAKTRKGSAPTRPNMNLGPSLSCRRPRSGCR